MFNIFKSPIFWIVLLVVALLVTAVPTFAQVDVPPDTVIVLPEGTPPPEFALEGILKSVYTIIYLPFAGAFVQILTQVTKPLPFLKNVRASVIVFVWTGVVWIVYIVVLHLGYGNQFKDVISAATTIGAMLIGIEFTPQVAQYLYEKNQKTNPGVLGYSRPERVPAAIRSTPPNLEGDLHA